MHASSHPLPAASATAVCEAFSTCGSSLSVESAVLSRADPQWDVDRDPAHGQPVYVPVSGRLRLEQAALRRDAFFGRTEQVPWERAVGRIAAEMLTPCPPGDPVVLIRVLREVSRRPARERARPEEPRAATTEALMSPRSLTSSPVQRLIQEGTPGTPPATDPSRMTTAC